jgi:hypothetical protein
MDLGLERYLRSEGFDEFVGPDRAPRPAARALCSYLMGLAEDDLLARRAAVDAAIVTMGITFTTYGDGASIDRASMLARRARISASSSLCAAVTSPSRAISIGGSACMSSSMRNVLRCAGMSPPMPA